MNTMALGSHEVELRKPYEAPTFDQRPRVMEGVFPPTLFPVLITSLSPTNLIDGFVPYLNSDEGVLFEDYASRHEKKLLELMEVVGREYRRGTDNFFKTVIGRALHQPD